MSEIKIPGDILPKVEAFSKEQCDLLAPRFGYCNDFLEMKSVVYPEIYRLARELFTAPEIVTDYVISELGSRLDLNPSWDDSEDDSDEDVPFDVEEDEDHENDDDESDDVEDEDDSTEEYEDDD